MMFFVAVRMTGEAGTYEDFERALKSLGPWSDRLGQTWLVESNFGARRIRDLLKPHLNLEAGDRLFVGQFTQHWAGTNMGQTFPEWMNRRNFGAPTPS